MKCSEKARNELNALKSAAAPLVTDDRAAAEEILDLRFKLKGVLKASEWAKVYPSPARKGT